MRAPALLASVVVAFMPLSCERDTKSEVRPVPKAEIAKLREFDKFELYYLGRSFAGERLTDAVCSGRAPDCFFGYGSCDANPDGLFDDGGCSIPLDIQNRSICARFPALFRPIPEAREVAGATVTSFDGIDVHTGMTTITVYGAGNVGGIENVISNLRSVQGGKRGALPPPAPGALTGELECQQSRLERRGS